MSHRHTFSAAFRKALKRKITTNFFGKRATRTEKDWIVSHYLDYIKDIHGTGNNGEQYTHCPNRAWALRHAKIKDAFATLENVDLVHLKWVPDNYCDMKELKGDSYNPDVNPDIRPSILKRQEKEFEAQVEREGVWGLIGEYYNGSEWVHADSCFGFVGQDAHDYEFGIMSTTLKALTEWNRTSEAKKRMKETRKALKLIGAL